jgi:2-hydroxy-3-oxopropionate reductase
MARSVNVIGLGLMGRPMARALIAAGFEVTGWNRSTLPPDQVAGIRLCSSPKEAATADVCLLVLADSAATDGVLARLEPHVRPGTIVLDMGSSDPSHSKEHARRLSARSIGWVDAPVSGGPEGAQTASLAIMAGGADADVTRVMPILQALGRTVHVGGPGTGHMVKAINQLIVGLTIEAVAEALILAERSGIDPRLVQEALKGGFADSRVLQIHGTRMIERAYVPGAKSKTQLKDLRLALKMGQAASLWLPHLASAATLYETLVDQGDGDLDHSALHKLL